MFGGVSSLKERFGDPCKSFRNTGKLSLSTAKQDKWYGGFVYSSEMVCLSLSLLRHASAFQKVCSSAKYGYQYISGLDMRHSQTFSNWVKPTFDKSLGTQSLCTGHCKKRIPTSKLLWFYRWNCLPHLQTLKTPACSIQWP